VKVARVGEGTVVRQCLARLQIEKPSVVAITQAPDPEPGLEAGDSHLTACCILLKKSGLQDQGFTFHSLHHTFATELFRKGKHPKIVQSLLGHSSITQTMDRYSHLLEGIGGDAVEGLDESFG
jgi:integrase